jgi:hypothetical protein
VSTAAFLAISTIWRRLSRADGLVRFVGVAATLLLAAIFAAVVLWIGRKLIN